MIYVDVTSCCRSSLNTGVQRVVRCLYKHLAASYPVLPLRWDEGAGGFCCLQEEELKFLTDPFARAQAASDNPERRSLWQKWTAAWSGRFSPAEVFPIQEKLRTGDVWLVPEIFKDQRARFFQAVPIKRDWKLIGLFYDAIALRFPDLNKAKRLRKVEHYMAALGRFDRVLCISQESEDDLRKFWREQAIPAVPTAVEYLGADFSAGGPRNPPNFPARRWLCVGTLEKRKNHLTLLAACARLWEEGQAFSLCLVGRAETAWGPAVVREIERLQAGGRAVEWLRHIDDVALAQEYARASATVFPSLIEGFGLPILESVWHRRPCLCGHNGALGEVAQGGGCLTVEQSDVTALAAGIRSLLQDETLYRKLYDETGRRLFRSWEEYAQRVAAYMSTGG